jgi:hypothetical protein
MNKHKAALSIAAAAVVLGIVWDVLMRRVPWGVNAFIWTALFIAMAFVCNRHRAPSLREPPADGTDAASPETAEARRPTTIPVLPVIAALLASLGLLWRDSEVLIALDFLLLVLFLPMLALGARGVKLHAAGVTEVPLAVVVTAVQTAIGFPQLLAQDLSWKKVPSGGFRGARIAIRGTLIAAPALVLFGALLSSADEQFENMLRQLFIFDLEEAFLHVVVTVIIAAICAGFLRSLVFSGPVPHLADRPELLVLPAAETNFALGLLNALFALFVAVQFQHFFGSAPDALSAYARRGFFELVWVVALVVPMLLLLDWLVRGGKRLFRTLAAIQIALVFVIAASAYWRMQLYREEFGLTRLRLFTTAFMIWVAVLLLWLAITVLTGRRNRFAIGALVTGVATVVILHVINPDALIVRTNLARAEAGKRPFDPFYAATLSDDAAPVIVANAQKFGNDALWWFMKRQPRTISWRTWNLSRARAIAEFRDYESKATPPIRPVREPGSTRVSSNSRRLDTSRNR